MGVGSRPGGPLGGYVEGLRGEGVVGGLGEGVGGHGAPVHSNSSIPLTIVVVSTNVNFHQITQQLSLHTLPT